MSQKNIQENLSQKIKEDLKDNPKVDVEKVSSFLSSGVPNMDEHNQKAAKVWSEKGVEEAVKFMFQQTVIKLKIYLKNLGLKYLIDPIIFFQETRQK